MCVSALFPKAPDPPTPPPMKKADPIVKAPPKAKALITPEDIAKVDYGSTAKKKKQDQQAITADSLKIDLGQTDAGSGTGGLNV